MTKEHPTVLWGEEGGPQTRESMASSGQPGESTGPLKSRLGNDAPINGRRRLNQYASAPWLMNRHPRPQSVKPLPLEAENEDGTLVRIKAPRRPVRPGLRV